MTAPPPHDVGVIGLGVMGSAMAGQMISFGSCRVFGYDIDVVRTQSLAEAGGVAVQTIAELAGAVDVIVVSLPSVGAFETVIAELSRGARPGLIVIETSTLPLSAKVAAQDALGEVGATLLDCPLSGTGQQARDGDLVAYVSGDAAAVDRVAPVIGSFTRNHHRLGVFGNGTKMKLIANLLVAVHNVAAAEAMLLASRNGLDLETVLSAVGDGAGSSRMFEVRGPLMAAGRYDDATIRMDVFAKDIGIIEDFASTSRTPTPLFSAASVVYRSALAQDRDAQDTASVYGVLSQLSSPMPIGEGSA